ncbi:fibronectin type III domain-containing protein [Candidatus Peregrinibacteria bacterium]|nr:MAG: fibronectin type III domain-containing protein [Candidatus Peregrinibacteria bacterium]
MKADIGQGLAEPAAGPVDHFAITKVPNRARVGELLSITVTAQDSSNNVVKNYTGTILFSVPDDENAVLPNHGEYTFKDSDLGTFTFDLSLQFSKLGFQAIQVFDQNNFRVSGEFPIEIVTDTSVIPAGTSSDLMVKSPSDGSEFGNNLLIITGSGPENINLKVFDNDLRIGDTETDGDGFFSFDAKNLVSGTHTFYVMSERAEVSNSVTVLIDTIPPVLNDFQVKPNGAVAPGALITITAQSEADLDSATLRLQGIDTPLTPSSVPGSYGATVAAPANDGSYPLDLVLVDRFGNKASLMNRFTLSVQSPDPIYPPQVTGVQAVATEQGIDLFWSGVTRHDRPIQSYSVYYGTRFNQLDQVAHSLDARTQFTLTDLTPETQYFIGLKAVDTQGLESEVLSDVLAITTLGDPETLPTASVSAAGLKATPLDSAVLLEWQPFDSIRAFYYQVHIGFNPGQYDDSLITPDNRTSITVPDLINGYPYYFAISALDVNGNPISDRSEPVQVIPYGGGFRPAAPVTVGTTVTATHSNQTIYRTQLQNVNRNADTGPASNALVILISLTLAHFMVLIKKSIQSHRTSSSSL